MDQRAPYQQNRPSQQQLEKLRLFPEELTWANTIKSAIDDAEHLRPISDFEIAQWALTSMENQSMDEVLDKIYKLQCFREMYGFPTVTPETSPEAYTKALKAGVELMTEYVRQLEPGHLLTIDYMPSQGHYLIVWDRAAFDPSRVQSECDWRIYQGCTYNLLMILTSNLQAVREGVSVILECHNMGVNNYDSQFEERRVAELFGYYPFKSKEFCFLNAPTVAVLLWKACKPFCNREFQKTVQLDGKIDGFDGRVDTLYNVPTFEYAQGRLLERLEAYVKERLDNQMFFSLSSALDTADGTATDETDTNSMVGSEVDSLADSLAVDDEDLEGLGFE